MDTHKDSYLKSQEGKSSTVEHCIEDTNGWELHRIYQSLIRKISLKNRVLEVWIWQIRCLRYQKGRY